MSTITPKYFDYNSLPDRDTRAFLRKQAASGKEILKRTLQGVWEMGALLVAVREKIPYGQFSEWIEVEFGMSRRSAYRFIGVFEAVPDLPQLCQNGTTDVSAGAIYRLLEADIDEEAREVGISLIASGDLKTRADANAFAEAAKPPKPAETAPEIEPDTDDDFDDTDPFAEMDLETPDASTPGESIEEELPISEGEASQYFDEDDEPEEEEAAPVVATPAPVKSAKPDTLKQRVKDAEVLHDTLDSNPIEAEMSDDDWLESLPIFRVLKQKQHRGIFVKRDLLAIRTLLVALNAFEHHARRAFDFKNPTGTPAETRVVAAAAMPRPLDWQLCAPCRGNGCGRCAHAGYDLTGAGISPLRVESGEVTL